MSTKTIAVDSRVYIRLAAAKREGESFSKAISRLLDTVGRAHTGEQILRELDDLPDLSYDDGETMLSAVAENRELETWDDDDDLR
jgi:predicted CopG family antitoxin